MKTLPLCTAIFALSLLGACISSQPNAGREWQSPMHVEHALTGQIWDVQARESVSEEHLLSVLQQSRVVILGEKHDNPDHHRIQREVVNKLLEAGALALASFEMLDTSQQAALDSLASVDLDSEDAVKSHLQWDDEGWQWPFYGPLLLDVARSGLPIRAGNISADEMMSVYGGALAPEVESALEEEQIARLLTEIDESHCGMLPESQFPSMVRVQQARDASMAKSVATVGAGVHVLIAGNFHARHDLGVTNYLPALDGAVVSVGIVEVSPQLQYPQDYLQASSDVMPYDYLWFTPAVTAEDYCAAMREGREQTALNESGNRSDN